MTRKGIGKSARILKPVCAVVAYLSSDNAATTWPSLDGRRLCELATAWLCKLHSLRGLVAASFPFQITMYRGNRNRLSISTWPTAGLLWLLARRWSASFSRQRADPTLRMLRLPAGAQASRHSAASMKLAAKARLVFCACVAFFDDLGHYVRERGIGCMIVCCLAAFESLCPCRPDCSFLAVQKLAKLARCRSFSVQTILTLARPTICSATIFCLCCPFLRRQTLGRYPPSHLYSCGHPTAEATMLTPELAHPALDDRVTPSPPPLTQFRLEVELALAPIRPRHTSSMDCI